MNIKYQKDTQNLFSNLKYNRQMNRSSRFGTISRIFTVSYGRDCEAPKCFLFIHNLSTSEN